MIVRCPRAASARSTLLALRGLRFEALRHGRRHEIRYRPAHQGDLAHERTRDMPHVRARRQEHRLDVGSHAAVHARHLHLIVEVGAIAQAPHDDRRFLGPRRVDRQRVECHDLEFAAGGLRDRRRLGFEHFDALVRGEQRHLARMHADADDEAIDHPRRTRDDVDVAFGRRIEGA